MINMKTNLKKMIMKNLFKKFKPIYLPKIKKQFAKSIESEIKGTKPI